MLDAHFHRRQYETFLGGDGKEMRFVGVHPWQTDAPDVAARLAVLSGALAADPRLGVGEIGLDRLRSRTISEHQREAFARQLALAAEFHRPVVLHGAKCWGEVVQACRPYRGRIPAFFFHGFSRSTGLLPDIVALNGFISVGSALLNDHAVNYREMAALLPFDRLLVETDLPDDDPSVNRAERLSGIYAALAELRGLSLPELLSQVVANAERFCRFGPEDDEAGSLDIPGCAAAGICYTISTYGESPESRTTDA